MKSFSNDLPNVPKELTEELLSIVTNIKNTQDAMIDASTQRETQEEEDRSILVGLVGIGLALSCFTLVGVGIILAKVFGW